MVALPEKPKVVTRIIKIQNLSLELSADQVETILREWAKSRGFSHRCQVTLYANQDNPEGASIDEEIVMNEEG